MLHRLTTTVVLGWLAIVPAASGHAEQTYFGFDSSPISWIGRGYTDYQITPDDGWSFEATRNQVEDSNAENHLSFYMTNQLPNDPDDPQPARNWLLQLAAPNNELIVPGLYTGATRVASKRDEQPGIDLSGTGRGEFTINGTFDVLEAEYASDGTIARFAVDFTTIEDNNPQEWIVGELRYQSLVPEPSTGFIALLGLGSLLKRQRRR
jgi:hypothetical protein